MKDHSSVFFPDVLALFNAVTREAYADTKLSEMFVWWVCWVDLLFSFSLIENI